MSVELFNRHYLKTDQDAFDAVAAGLKTHEIRFDDRGFKVGDYLILKKTLHTCTEMKSGAPLLYVGQPIVKRISHIVRSYGLQDGWAILSLESEESFCRIAELEVALAKAQEDAPKWISIKDRLPEMWTEVMVHPAPTDYCMTASVDRNGLWHYSEDDHEGRQTYETSRVTHWMPLPSAPTPDSDKP